MIKNNSLDKIFGPVGTSAGIFLFVIGIIMTYFSLIGLVLIGIGAFLGFSSTSTSIDFEKKRLRFTNNIFGIFPIGHWINIQNNMRIGIKKSNNKWRAFSRSNRILDIAKIDYRIILYGSNGKEIMPIQKSKNLDSLKNNLLILSNHLNLKIL